MLNFLRKAVNSLMPGGFEKVTHTLTNLQLKAGLMKVSNGVSTYIACTKTFHTRFCVYILKMKSLIAHRNCLICVGELIKLLRRKTLWLAIEGSVLRCCLKFTLFLRL